MASNHTLFPDAPTAPLAPPSAPPAVSPVRMFAVILAIAFSVELGIMFVMLAFEPFSWRAVMLSVTDAMTLTVVLAPAVWVAVVRPLRRLLQQRGLLLARVFEGQEAERARLSRDLHDELGQQLTAVLLGLRAAEEAPDLAVARRRASDAREIVATTLDGVRRISRGLSPTVLVDFGLGPAVERVCEDVAAATGLRIERDLQLPERRTSPLVEMAAYRVLQEAITNAAKHSRATEVRVGARFEGGGLALEVRDNGVGFPAPGAGRVGPDPGLGVQGMRERVSLLGGRFSVTTGRDAGTTIAAWIPEETLAHEPHRGDDRR